MKHGDKLIIHVYYQMFRLKARYHVVLDYISPTTIMTTRYNPIDNADAGWINVSGGFLFSDIIYLKKVKEFPKIKE